MALENFYEKFGSVACFKKAYNIEIFNFLKFSFLNLIAKSIAKNPTFGTPMSAQTLPHHFPKILVISVVVAIILLGMNMRSPIVGFGAVASLIQADLQLSTKTIGFIGAVPMFAFALSSFLAPKLSQKIGLESTMLLSALLLTLGIIGRVWSPGVGFLLVGTILLSLAISLGNVLVPAVIKKYTPHRIGFVMGCYSMTLSVFAGIAAGIAMPLVQWGNVGDWQGWRFALGIWGGVAGLALLAWVAVMWLRRQTRQYQTSSSEVLSQIPNQKQLVSYPSVWRIKMAWWISGYMGLQSLLYYTLASFLPSLLIDKGLTPEQAGKIGMIFQFMAFPSILLLSRWVAKGYTVCACWVWSPQWVI